MSSIVCPACKAYLGLNATNSPVCPKCGALLKAAREAEVSPNDEMKPEDARNRDLTHGALWLIGGIVVTAVSYMAAAANGEGYYILAWGAVLGGAAQFLQGLLGSYSKPGKTTKPTKRGGSCKACRFSPVVPSTERCPRCNISDPNPETPEPRVSCLTLFFAFATAVGGVAYGLVVDEIGLAIILGLIGFFVGIGIAALARIGASVLKWMFG